ncbi:hypothetical protein [Streptomyces sp. R44]|uniref:DUF4253 domain-containing protein n=1 Tax=Streptomyces sp. R44 TaxID=3238633 RepID=A0AB39TFP6_9ACTN
MHPDQSHARLRLDAALDRVAVTFRGMTARPDETNCACHWGSAEELARLKVADVELDLDLLQRTWQATDWTDHASMLRRILPQLATTLVDGLVEPLFGAERVGLAFALGNWQEWPTEQAAAVEEFLQAWWAYTLTDPDPTRPAHDLLVLAAEATGTVSPWLDSWEGLRHPVTDGHLAEAADRWEYDLLGDRLPWSAWENEEEMRIELTAWLVRHAPARLRVHGASEDLLHRIRLLGVTGPDRWDDPHWPGHRY